MNYGRFFEIDFESSLLQEGIVVFNYRWLQDKTQVQGRRESPRFPIYLTFSPESILFNLHYRLSNNPKDSCGMDKVHYHNTIIELRLSPNIEVADGLTDSLNNAYEAEFPMKTNGVLRKMIEKSFGNHDFRVDGFTCFEAFNVEQIESYQGEGEKAKETHFLRRLILDFLYDFEFTDVFKNVAFYDELSVKLKENFLFNALLNKTRYYYYRTELCAKDVVERCLQVQSEEELEKCDKGLKFFLEQYAKAEHDWLNSILDERSMKIFHESPWFDESYEELEQVYYTNRSGKWKRGKEKISSGVDNVPGVSNVPKVDSRKKPLRKAESRKRYLKRIGAADDSFKLTVSNLLTLTRKMTPELRRNTGTFGTAVTTHCDIAKEAAFWEVGHYHFVGLWKLWFGSVAVMLWSALVGIPILLLAFKWFYHLYYFHEDSRLHEWSFVLPVVMLLLFLVTIGWIIHRHFRSTWGIGSIALMMPRLLAAVVAAWFTMSMSEDLVHYFIWKEPFQEPAIIILSCTTLLFVVYESRLKNPYDNKRDYFLSSLFVFAIAYIYSVIVGLMVYDFFGKTIVDGLIEEKSVLVNHVPTIRCVMKFVLKFSFFATFIGIFLQLMFQGKAVTESK